MRSKQPWIYSPSVDSLFILLPAFLALFAVVLFPSVFQHGDNIPVTAWIILILLIDVAHVYSTLYRTYFDKETFQQKRSLLVNVPLFAWMGGVLIYSVSGMLFWRLLAYLAVFHFIRQQYGFMRIYSRKEQQNKLVRWIDHIAVYYATLYPIIYWHLHAPRNFNWFIEGDFYYFSSAWLPLAALIIYIIVVATYIVKETWLVIRTRQFNIPRNAIIIGTFLSWFFGIVYYNGDLAFTTINVVSHGIPYMALVWIYGKKKYSSVQPEEKHINPIVFGKYGVLLFLAIVFLFSFVEEGLWDAMVWNEHRPLFGMFDFLPSINNNKALAFLVPLLSLPQVTHYILDAFIWKIRKDDSNWKKVTLGE